ncbi:hypothetical protein QTO34_012803 [Cnephaeus nilssonii]|uniref:Uncharacterized protein n=1 Tax=Cnephaeus nilssonii TaxID=3371016 RepID=A0AA40HAX0_CNENI|nr:hypothetical protein QTO34_012803 [Eptesicus nilssonii]
MADTGSMADMDLLMECEEGEWPVQETNCQHSAERKRRRQISSKTNNCHHAPLPPREAGVVDRLCPKNSDRTSGPLGREKPASPTDYVEEQRSAQRASEAERSRRRRQTMSEEQRLAQRASAAERKRRRLQKMSEEERLAQRTAAAERRRRRLQGMSEEERLAQRTSEAERSRRRRQTMSEEQRLAQRASASKEAGGIGRRCLKTNAGTARL